MEPHRQVEFSWTYHCQGRATERCRYESTIHNLNHEGHGHQCWLQAIVTGPLFALSFVITFWFLLSIVDSHRMGETPVKVPYSEVNKIRMTVFYIRFQHAISMDRAGFGVKKLNRVLSSSSLKCAPAWDVVLCSALSNLRPSVIIPKLHV
jgi:hypothetical protein